MEINKRTLKQCSGCLKKRSLAHYLEVKENIDGHHDKCDTCRTGYGSNKSDPFNPLYHENRRAAERKPKPLWVEEWYKTNSLTIQS